MGRGQSYTGLYVSAVRNWRRAVAVARRV